MFFYIFFINYAYSEIINKFNITGNNRVTDETILMFSNLEIGESIDQNKLNNALKELYYTDYFKNVKIYIKNNVVNIIVEENPIIQSIIIKGVKNNNLNEYDIIDNKVYC